MTARRSEGAALSRPPWRDTICNGSAFPRSAGCTPAQKKGPEVSGPLDVLLGQAVNLAETLELNLALERDHARRRVAAQERAQ